MKFVLVKSHLAGSFLFWVCMIPIANKKSHSIQNKIRKSQLNNYSKWQNEKRSLVSEMPVPKLVFIMILSVMKYLLQRFLIAAVSNWRVVSFHSRKSGCEHVLGFPAGSTGLLFFWNDFFSLTLLGVSDRRTQTILTGVFFKYWSGVRPAAYNTVSSSSSHRSGSTSGTPSSELLLVNLFFLYMMNWAVTWQG